MTPRRRFIAAALAFAAGLALAGFLGIGWPLRPNVFALGAANGALAIAAIGSMMALAGRGQGGREGLRVGMWGGAQAIAFGTGGLSGTLAADLARRLLGPADIAYGTVFAAQALLFLIAAGLAAWVWRSPAP